MPLHSKAVLYSLRFQQAPHSQDALILQILLFQSQSVHHCLKLCRLCLYGRVLVVAVLFQMMQCRA